ncbi:unnamed protein product [Closterium sp. NIES-54]
MGPWELVECPRSVNIMKNRWVLMTKYHIDDMVARKKARLLVKGFTQVYGADYDKTYVPVGSYVTLRIFLSIVAFLDLHLIQLDMKNAFLQSRLYRSPLLGYKGLDNMLTGAEWQKIQVDDALYFKVGDGGVTCWVLVYVDDLLTDSSSLAMLKELKLLNAGTPTVLGVDNQSAIMVAEGLGLKGNLKHMERRCACLQQMVKREKLILRYILATEQPADFLTKALHFPAFNWCCRDWPCVSG